MRVFVEYPTDEVGKAKLDDAIAEIHAFLTINKIEKLNLDSQSKKKIIKKVIEHVKNEIENENKQLKYFVRA